MTTIIVCASIAFGFLCLMLAAGCWSMLCDALKSEAAQRHEAKRWEAAACNLSIKLAKTEKVLAAYRARHAATVQN